jgi:hypothetical protein
MPSFAAVRCCSCQTFQVQQAKQSLKWKCGICGELQPVKKARIFFFFFLSSPSLFDFKLALLLLLLLLLLAQPLRRLYKNRST